MTISQIDNCSDDELRGLFAELSEGMKTISQQERNEPMFKFPMKMVVDPFMAIVQKPAVYPLIADCANFSRFGYAISHMPDDLQEIYFNLPRNAALSQVDIEDISGLNMFNLGLKWFHQTFKGLMTNQLKVLKLIKVKDQGGSCCIALEPEKKWLIVIFKGTTKKQEWKETNLKMKSVHFHLNNPWMEKHPDLKGIKVHEGYHSAIKNLSENYQFFEILDNYRKEYPDYKLVITGHSLGAALACVCGIEAQALGWNPLCISFGGTRVAYLSMKSRIKAQITGEEKSYQSQINKLFDITPEKIYAIQHDSAAPLDLNSGCFINIEHEGDIMPCVPRPSYERPGGIPYILQDHNSFALNISQFWPQKLVLDADVDIYSSGLKESKNYAIKTNQFQQHFDEFLKKKFPIEGVDDEEKASEDRHRSFSVKIFDLLELDKLMDIHRFYVMYNLALELNPLKGFIKTVKGNDTSKTAVEVN